MTTFLDRIRLLMAPGEAGAGPASAGASADGGAAAGADAGDDSIAVEEVPDQPEAHASGDAVDDDDNDEDDYVGVDQTNPLLKALVNRARKSARQLRRQREIVDGMRGPGGRFLNPAELRQKAEYGEYVAQRAAKDQRLRRMLDDEEPEPAPVNKGKAAAVKGDGDPFEQFDPDHPATPLLRRLYESNEALQKQVSELANGVKQNETNQATAQQRAEVTAWTEAIDSASKAIPKVIKLPQGGTLNLRDVFSDSVKGAYIAARQQGKRLDVQKVIAHYLKQAGVKASDATRVAADAQRAAEHNKSLPRAGAVVPGGRPSPAKTAKETVSDVSRRIMGRSFA